MTIAEKDCKILWGRAAGRCSNPECGIELTHLIEVESYTIGEMAHIIAQSAHGPRGNGKGGDDVYENLILLCPNCHTKIDKAPEGTYPETILRQWKVSHEQLVAAIPGLSFADRGQLNREISMLLDENHRIWITYGPKSLTAINNPMSNLAEVWKAQKLSAIIPNNKRIIAIIKQNKSFFIAKEQHVIAAFVSHAEAFEQHQYGKLDDYPPFPESFKEIFHV